MPEDWNDVICIDEWPPDESFYENGFYPEGAREKAVYFSPDDVGDLPLRPKWRYLFKKSRSWAPWQFWMEVMAYRIGEVMGVPVPPAHVGLINRENLAQATYGALIEWFYGENEWYVDGARFIAMLIPGYDHKTGRQHNLQTILGVLSVTNDPDSEASRDRLVHHWAKVLTFDSVIGNVDRHPVNWGIVFSLQHMKEDPLKARPSPAFDNGTSMSYEQREDHFEKFDDEQYTMRYLTRRRKARHHMRWSLEDLDHVNFFEFMRRFVSEYPGTRASIMPLLEFTEADLRVRLEPLATMDVEEAARLTPRRLDFTLKLIMKRTELLRDALDRA